MKTHGHLAACEYCIMLLECGITIKKDKMLIFFRSASEHLPHYCLIPESVLPQFSYTFLDLLNIYELN